MKLECRLAGMAEVILHAKRSHIGYTGVENRLYTTRQSSIESVISECVQLKSCAEKAMSREIPWVWMDLTIMYQNPFVSRNHLRVTDSLEIWPAQRIGEQKVTRWHHMS